MPPSGQPTSSTDAVPSDTLLASIPPDDIDLISFFDDEAAQDDIFEVLENWTSETLASGKTQETVPSFQPLLSSFRSKAYVDHLDQALMDPQFKIETEQMVDDLNAFPDLPPELTTELNEYVHIFAAASELHTKWSILNQEMAQIEVDSEEDRTKLEKLKTELLSIKDSTSQIVPELMKLKQSEEETERTLAVLQRELDSIKSKHAALKLQSREIMLKQKDLWDEGKGISLQLSKSLDQKRRLEVLCASRKQNLDQAYQAYEALKSKFYK